MTAGAPGSVRSAVVLGLGTSGEAASLLLCGEGARVVALDAKAPEPGVRERLESAGVSVVAPCETVPESAFDLAVASPGVRLSAPWFRELGRRQIPVVSELELGWSRRGRARTLAVTGSNGKSTLVKLCAEALAHAGCRAAVGGNYGPPASGVVREQPGADWLVLEVSSFQLETVTGFRPDVGVIFNLYPNHLDRHGSMEEYAGLKARMLRRTGPDDAAVLHEGALALLAPHPMGAARRIVFGAGEGADCRYAGGQVLSRVRAAGGEPADPAPIAVAGTFLDNDVMGLTAAAAVAALEACGFSGRHVAACAPGFRKLPHRMEEVASLGGVRFIDDSKATNMAAVSAALAMLAGRVRLIAGGLLKERNVATLKDSLAKKVIKVYGIGESAPSLAEQWGECVPVDLSRTLPQAVAAAWREAGPGDVILLSPGCASFDQFRSFEDRGRQFAELAKELGKERV